MELGTTHFLLQPAGCPCGFLLKKSSQDLMAHKVVVTPLTLSGAATVKSRENQPVVTQFVQDCWEEVSE